MEKKDIYNEAVKGDNGFPVGEDYPSCGGEACANVAEKQEAAADTMADDAKAEESNKAEKSKDSKEKKESTDDVLAQAKNEIGEWKEKLMRLHAEFDNYRKRTLKEKMDLVQSGGRDVLLAMLPVRDDVQRAMDAMQKSDDIEALRAGVTLISQKFTESLRQKGVVAIDIKGKDFDADLCEAVAKVAAGDEMKGKVVEVVQTGYMLGDKVLRFAKVVVGE